MKTSKPEPSLHEKARLTWWREGGGPPIVSVMGQTGTGKSSLINALSGLDLKTDPVKPCTRDIEKVVVHDGDGGELHFFDMPGIGGAGAHVDAGLLAAYRSQMLVSDVVVWAMPSDGRSVALDLMALETVLGPDPAQRAQLMNKFTFVSTKVDLLGPGPWVFSIGDEQGGIFVPGERVSEILRRKEDYFQEIFIEPFGKTITARTYNDGSLGIPGDPSVHVDADLVSIRGYLSRDRLDVLRQRHPLHEAVFTRLYDNYRIIPCSAQFRYNLNQLMVVIVNKLGGEAAMRFSSIAASQNLVKVSTGQAKQLCNMAVYRHGGFVFLMTQQDLGG